MFTVYLPANSTRHRRRIKTDEKEKVVGSVWGGSIYSIPCRATWFYTGWFELYIGWSASWDDLKEKDKFILFFKFVPVQNSYSAAARQGIEYIFPPNSSDHLYLFFCICPSSMTMILPLPPPYPSSNSWTCCSIINVVNSPGKGLITIFGCAPVCQHTADKINLQLTTTERLTQLFKV